MSAQLTALLAAILWLQATAVPAGNHTCTGVVKHPVTVLVNVTEPVTFRSYTWCLRVPPRCSKYTVQLKDRVKLHVEMHNKTITVCCEGYVEMEGRCVPACPTGADCPFMRCNRTNHCHCTPGYTGLYCNEACPRGLWGKDCKRPCDCPSGYTCHHLTGDCFVDDRPPRRTTTPTTTSTTTIRPTTTTTTPTTEGTTLETVKTPVFRFPPPPWVESAGDTKKTTTHQAKKEEAPPTYEMEVSKEISEMTYHRSSTKESQIETSLPTSTTVQVSNKTNAERPSTVGFFHPLKNKEEVTNEKIIDDSTNAKDLVTKDGFPIESFLSTTPFKPSAEPKLQSNDENLTQLSVTLSKELFTPVITSSTPDFKNILKLHTSTIQTPLEISITSDLQNITKTSPMVVQTSPISDYTEFTNPTTSKPKNSTEKRLTKATETATTHQLHQGTKSMENTIENEIQTENLAFSINDHNIESTVTTTFHENVSTIEPKSSMNPRFLVPFIKLPSTIKSITKGYEIGDEKKPTIHNQQQPTMTVLFSSTKSNHSEEKLLTSILPENDTLHAVFKTENTSPSSTFNNPTFPPAVKTLFSQAPQTYTVSNISITSHSNIPNHADINDFSVTRYSEQSVAYDNIISKNTAIPFTPLLNLATATTTMSNLLTTPITLTTTVIPTTKKSLIIPTTIKIETIPSLTTSSLQTSSKTITSTNAGIAATTVPTIGITPTVTPPITVSATFPFAFITQPTIITPIKADIPTTKKYKTPTFTDNTKPQIIETPPTTVSMPALATDIFKDFNTHKKQKLEETQSSYPGQDKPKKKHEKIKPKNMNAKEFPSIYQIKTEKHNETILQQTTEISLRSILQAETFKNKVLSTKSPRPSKIPESVNINIDTDRRTTIETVNNAPTPSNPNQIWYALKKQNFSNTDMNEQSTLGTLEEPSEISGSNMVSTEMNRVMESNTIDYRQSSEEPIKKMVAQEEETNYSLIFNKIKFNMTESIAAGVKASREDSSYFHLPMILVLGIALVTLLLLTLTFWVYLKRRREQAEPFYPCIMAYAIEEPPPMDSDSFDQAFFCPTFTNNYAERINRELRELNYDHPRSSQQEPLYAEIFN